MTKWPGSSMRSFGAEPRKFRRNCKRSNPMSETYFITGGAGNLACQLTFELVRDGSRVVLFDVAEGPRAQVAPGSEYIRGDLTQIDRVESLLKQHRGCTVLHFASLLSGSCDSDRSLAWRINMDGSFGLFEASLRTGVKTFFIPSTLATYGGNPPSPMSEDYPQWPGGLYGVTKVACERLGAYYHEKHGLDFRCLRLPVVISRDAPAGAASAYASRAFVEGVLEGSFTFRVNPHTRVSTMYVKDVLRAMVGLLRSPAENLTRRVYNIHAIAPTAAEIAETIRRRVPGVRFDFDPEPAVANLIESWPCVLDDASARRDWKWSMHYDLETLAADFISELLKEKGETAN